MPFLARISILLTILILCGCNKNDLAVKPFILYDLDYRYDYSSYSPLTAELELTTNQPLQVTTTVLGKNNSSLPFTKIHSLPDTTGVLPILGLYGNHNNQVVIGLYNVNDKLVHVDTLTIPTNPVSAELPNILIETVQLDEMKPGFNLVNNFSYNTQAAPQIPFMFDHEGEIRWYLDYSEHPLLGKLFYDVGLIHLTNGHFAFGDKNSNTLYEINSLGNIINSWPLEGYRFHHALIEKPNGNFVVTVSEESSETIEDIIIELDRTTGNVINTWDLKASLQQDRLALAYDNNRLDRDWFHANGLYYDKNDNTIVVSGRTQGLVKLSNDNKARWIMAPHRGWNTSDNGLDLTELLLHPIDTENQLISDNEVLDGAVIHPDFEWNWYQHSPILLSNGNLMVFDNGFRRNYNYGEVYSRAVEYNIDLANKRIKQVWSFGQERPDMYSSITSSVRAHEEQNNILMAAGSAGSFSAPYGRILEIDKATKEVVFEATIAPKTSWFGITFHSVERITLE